MTTVNQMNMYTVGMPPTYNPKPKPVNRPSKRVALGTSTKALRPTHRILELARSRTVGKIRWTEAARIYLQCSEAAREDERTGATHYHLNLQHIFRRHFRRLERGLYQLRTRWLVENGLSSDGKEIPGR